MHNIIEVRNLEKRFGQNLVLKDINMDVKKGGSCINNRLIRIW